MNDKTKETLQKLLKRLDLVVLAALLVLMTAGLFMILSERNYQLEEPPAPPTRQWNVRIPNERSPDVQNPDYAEIRENFYEIQPRITEDREAARLIRNNMFAMKTAEEAAAFEQEMNRLYNQAERLFQEQRYPEAQAAVGEILLQDPNNRNAKELQGRLSAILTPASPATAPAAP